MVNKLLREKIIAYAKNEDIEITILDDPSFDNSIVGISNDGRLIYDYQKMVEELSADDEIDLEEADEFIQYNTLRAIPYMDNAPIITMINIEQLNDGDF